MRMKMTESEFRDHCNEYNGYCVNCNCIGRWGNTEPDAEEYECDECGDNTCMGIEQAMLMGHISIRG
jgi:hypothetical protein